MAGTNDDLGAQALFRFRVMDEKGMAPSPTEFVGLLPLFTFRMAPQAIQIQRSIRSEVLKDLNRGISIVTGGEGIGRIVLHGTHGVGASVDLTKPSEGREFRDRLTTFFQSFVNANEERGRKGREPLRLIWEMVDGKWSMPERESYLVWPENFPSDSISAARPHAWDWSCSLVLLAPYTLPRGSDPAKVVTPDDIVSRSSSLEDVLGAFVSSWKKASSVLQNVRDLKNKLSLIRSRVLAFSQGAQNAIYEVTDLVRGSAQLCQQIQTALSVTDLRDTATTALRGTIYEVRRLLGDASVTAQQFNRSGVVPSTLSSPQTSSLSRPIVIPVSPGDTLQSLASRGLGDASRWQEIVSVNNLDFPFLDFSGPGGTPDPAYAGLNVAGATTLLKMPLPALSAPVGVADDPVGTDYPDAPSAAGLLQGGVENLSAALLRRLQTPRGRIPWHPEYGSMLPQMVGSAQSLGDVEALRAEVEDTLQADPRVLGVENLSVSVSGPLASVDGQVITPLGLVKVAGAVS